MSHEDEHYDSGALGTLPPPETLHGQTELSAPEQMYSELYGRSFNFLRNVMSNEISDLAVRALTRTIEGPLHSIEHEMGRVKDSTEGQKREIEAEERKAHGFSALSHALAAGIHGEYSGSTVVLSRAPEYPKEGGGPKSPGRDNYYNGTHGVYGAEEAKDMIYEVLGVLPPNPRGPLRGHSRGGRLTREEKAENRKHDASLSEHVKVNRDPETGEVTEVITETPFGVTVVESWGGSLEPLEILSSKDHSRVGEERDTVEHTISFHKTKEGVDETRLDEIANAGELSPKSAELRGQIDGIAEDISEKSRKLDAEEERLQKRSESKLPFRRPSEETVYEIQVEADKARTTKAVMDELRGLSRKSPERTDGGFKAVIAERKHGLDSEPLIERSLDVKSDKARGGLNLTVNHPPSPGSPEGWSQVYHVSEEGVLSRVYTNPEGEEILLPMDGLRRERKNGRYEAGHEPAWTLVQTLKEFNEKCKYARYDRSRSGLTDYKIVPLEIEPDEPVLDPDERVW